jgi:capsular polysaccharide biosynthesis protein
MDKYEDNYEKEIALKDLFFKLLYNWRKIFVVSLIFAVLIGGYKYLSGMRSFSNQATVKSQEEAFQTAQEVYNSNKVALENDIKNITTGMKRQKDYNENSVLMQIDPFNEKVASKSFNVSTDYKIMPDKTYQNIDTTKSVTKAYLAAAQNGDMYNYIMDNLSFDIELRYLKELISISNDEDTNIINIKVIHSDSKACEEIFNLVLDYFDQLKSTITAAVGEHTLTGIDESMQSVVDIDLDTKQKTNLDTSTTYEKNLIEKQNQLNALVAPVRPVISKSIIMKSTIKYAIVGFILGAFLITCILLFTILTSDKLLNAKDLRSRYNIRVLGILEKNKKKRLFMAVDKLISRLEGNSNHQIGETEVIKRISSNLKAICELNNIDNGSIFFTGTIKQNLIKELCEKVQMELKDTSYQLLSGANISYSADTIDLMKSCKTIVIVEEIGTSTYTEFTKQLECIDDLGKNVVGIILV